MAYQVLARKWRPQDFSSLVGQEHIVTALRNALQEGRIAQAYLFSGIRGVGKTTAARVLAKALNCERGPAADPCNECTRCREIGAGASLDMLEVDAATYSKVEQIRELTETLRYAPAGSRYKVVVLDEVHRLSRQAFDALLKIVEEPPPHLVFIFATTEIDAVPATILSRCQEYQFRRVPSPILAAHLRHICDEEKITVSDNALRLIARAGEGSVRDSVALLDQLATFGSGNIADEDASHLLGGFDTALFQRLVGAILDGEPAKVHQLVAEIEEKGWDPQHVFGQFLLFVRDGLHLALGASPTAVDLAAEDAEALARRVKPAGYERLLQVLNLLLSCEAGIRRSEFGLLALEIAWLRAAELPKVVRIEELLADAENRGSQRPALDVRDSYRPPALKMSASEPERRQSERDLAAAAPEPRDPELRHSEIRPAEPSAKALFGDVFSSGAPVHEMTAHKLPVHKRPLDEMIDSIGSRRARRGAEAGSPNPANLATPPASKASLDYDLETLPAAVKLTMNLYNGRLVKVRPENDDEENP